MPIHDWTRVDGRVFDAFQLIWNVELAKTLNRGVLPGEYYALIGDHGGLTRAVTIRESAGDRFVAVVEVVALVHINTQEGIRTLVSGICSALRKGIHVLAVDLHERGPRDRRTLHDLVWESLGEVPPELPSDRPLIGVSCDAVGEESKAPEIRGYVEPLAVGDVIPDMPLFLRPGHFVLAPLEATYNAALAGIPQRWMSVLMGTP